MISNKVKIMLVIISITFCSCSNNKNSITSDFFDELITGGAIYESLDDYLIRKKIDVDSLDFDSYYNKYLVERKEKINGKIYVSTRNKLILDIGDKDILKEEGYINESSQEYDDIASLNVRSKYKLIEFSDNTDAKSKSFIGVVNFSNFIFNKNSDKAVFLFEFFCGLECFREQLVYIGKNKKGKWEVEKIITVSVS